MEDNTKICPKCGNECSIGDLYCTKCSYKFDVENIQKQERKKKVDEYTNNNKNDNSDEILDAAFFLEISPEEAKNGTTKIVTLDFENQKELEVNVPPNSYNGTKICFEKEGYTNDKGDKGDLYIVISVIGNSQSQSVFWIVVTVIGLLLFIGIKSYRTNNSDNNIKPVNQTEQVSSDHSEKAKEDLPEESNKSVQSEDLSHNDTETNSDKFNEEYSDTESYDNSNYDKSNSSYSETKSSNNNHTQQSPKTNVSNAEQPKNNIVSNAKKPDFQPFMNNLQVKIRRNWNPPQVPGASNVVVLMKIGKDGQLLSVNIIQSSGVQIVDNAAMYAVRSSAPFELFPEDSDESSVNVEFTFDYK